MKPIPEIILESTSIPFSTKIKTLTKAYSGIYLTECGEKRSLIDEIEFNLEMYLLQIKGGNSIVENCELIILQYLSDTIFNKLVIKSKDNIWHPRKMSFTNFKIKNIDNDFSVNVTQKPVIDLRNYFLSL